MSANKKILSVIMTLVMLLAGVSGVVEAPLTLRAFAAGSGTQSDPFQIASYSDFQSAMQSNNAGTYYRQTANFNITLSQRYTGTFRGNYDGNGYTITVTNSEQTKLRYTNVSGSVLSKAGGVFDQLASGAVVQNLNVHVSVTVEGRAWCDTGRSNYHYTGGNDYFGGIAGENAGTIENCGVTGSITMTQRLGDKYTPHKDTYNNFKYLLCNTMVGGVSGLISSGGAVRGCYSAVTIYLGSNSANQFEAKYDQMIGNPSYNVDAQYALYAGGLAGEMNGGTVESCLADGVTIYMGNAQNNNVLSSNRTTYAAAGGIVGLAYGNAPTIRNNVRRGGYLYANLGSNFGAAGALVGFANGASSSNFADNYTDTFQTTSGYQNGNGWYYGTDIKSVHSSMALNSGISAKSNPSVSDLNNTYWTGGIRGGGDVELIWRTTPAPTVDSAGATIAQNYLKITIEAPDRVPPLSGGSKMDGSQIRYELAITTFGQLAAPKAEPSVNGQEVVLTSTESDVALYHGTAVNQVDTPGNIDVSSLAAGAPVEYYIQARSTTGAMEDSEIRKITVTRPLTIAPQPQEVAEQPPVATNKLATPGAEWGNSYTVIDLTLPSGADGVRWGTSPTALNQTTLTLGVSSLNSSPTPASFQYYVKAVDSTTAFEDSEILQLSFSVVSGVGQSLVRSGVDPGHVITKGVLATPGGTLKSADREIELHYPGTSSLTGITFRHGTTSPPATTGDTITGVDVGKYYVQSVPPITMTNYDPSPVMEINVAASTTLAIEYDGSDSAYSGASGDTTTFTFTTTPQIHTTSGSSMTLEVAAPSYSPAPSVVIPGFSIAPGSAVELTVWMDGQRCLEDTVTLATPGATAKPIISPGTNGNLGDGIAITAYNNADIYYTISFDGTEPPRPSTVSGDVNTKKYTGPITWSALKSDFTGPSMRIKAVAQVPGNTVSAMADVEYTVANKPQEEAPRLTVDNASFNPATYYTPGAKLHFTHNDSADGEIWYTWEGNIPVKGSVGAAYDPSDPYTLPQNRSSVEIRAYLARDNFPDTQLLSETILMKAPHGTPLYSLNNNARVPIGQPLTFLPEPTDLPEQIRPSFYLRESDVGNDEGRVYRLEEVRNLPDTYYGVLEVDASLSGTFNYSNYSAEIPTLTYTIEGNSRTYSFGTPEIRFLSEGVEQEHLRIEHVPPEEIILNGSAGDQVNVTAQLTSKNSGKYEDGDPTTRTFTFYNAVEAPKSSPGTSDDNLTTMSVGQTVSLACQTSGAEIFYSTTGNPQVQYNAGVYEPVPGSDTQPYVSSSGVTVKGTPGGYFTVYAVACREGFSQSEYTSFTYKIADMNQVSAPTATPSTSVDNVASVANGSRVVLVSATAGASIFYSTEGVPEVEFDDATKSYKILSANTMDYNDVKSVGIEVQGQPGGVFNIYTVAVKDGMGDSAISTLTYQIAPLVQVEAPIASPGTSSGDIATLQSGSAVLLTCATPDAQIYYSTAGTPAVTQNPDGSYSPANSGTLRYNDTQGITVSGGAGSFFTVSTIAVKSGMNPSDVAIYPYQLPAPVQSVYAAPSSGEVVKGTEVKLSTSTEGATIFYEIAHGNRSASDPVPYESQPYDEKTPIIIDETTSIAAVAEKNGVVSAVTEYEYTVSNQVQTPRPNIPGGSVVPRGTKVVLTTTSGASVTYTKDGSDPSVADNKNRMYGAEIALDAEEGKSVSITAYATKTGMTPSETVSLSYTIAKSEEVFTASPPTDSVVRPGDLITLTTSVSDAEIYYTVDGSDPTTSSTKGNSIQVEAGYGETLVLRAIAVFHGNTTVPQVFTYHIIDQTSAPSASIPDGAIIMAGAQVELTAPEGAIHYTTDGSDPTTSSQMYTGPIALTGSTVLKAIAVADDKAPSAIAQYIYTMAGQVAAPAASETSGTLVTGAQITLSTTTEGATIYYSTNGTDPTDGNLKDLFVYDSPITVSRPVTLKMFAVKTGLHSSVINSVTYTVEHPQAEEEEQDGEDSSRFQTDTDKLFLFDQFVDAGDGPLFEDIVLRDPVTQVVVSAEAGSLPEGVQLVAQQERNPSPENKDSVMRTLDLRLESMYDITLLHEEQAVQPQKAEAVEVGIPIPKGYEDTIVIVCHIGENGVVTGYPTRRSGGVAYAVVDHFSKFAIAVPDYAQAPGANTAWLWVALGVAFAGASSTAVLLVRRRKKEKNKSV